MVTPGDDCDKKYQNLHLIFLKCLDNLDNYCQIFSVKCKSTLASSSTHEIM